MPPDLLDRDADGTKHIVPTKASDAFAAVWATLDFLLVLQDVHRDDARVRSAHKVEAAAHDRLHVSLMPRVGDAATAPSSMRPMAAAALALRRHVVNTNQQTACIIDSSAIAATPHEADLWLRS